MFAEKGGEEAYVVFSSTPPATFQRHLRRPPLQSRPEGPHRFPALLRRRQDLDQELHPGRHHAPLGRDPLRKGRRCSGRARGRCSSSIVGMPTPRVPPCAACMPCGWRPIIAPLDAGFRPLEVTFTWNERQADYTLVTRSHTQLVEHVPLSYDDQRGRRGSSRRGLAGRQSPRRGPRPTASPRRSSTATATARTPAARSSATAG